MQNFIECRERIRIRDYHKFLSELSPSQRSKVVSSLLCFYLYTIIIHPILILLCFAEYMLSFLQTKWVMQLCILFLSREKTLRVRTASFTQLMSDLGNQRFFFNTYNARISKLSIDYAWSGCIFKSKPGILPQEQTKYSEKREIFSANREIML
jgi:hypothetical protein